MSDEKRQQLLDKFEVAARLGVHFSTVERLIASDELPVIRLGPPHRRQLLRFRWDDVEAWLSARTVGRRKA